MAASPDLSRLPPRGPRDLGVLKNTLQIDNREILEILNALLVICTTLRSYFYKN
jgi:hypothetical protein